jgi:hypothetical protein
VVAVRIFFGSSLHPGLFNNQINTKIMYLYECAVYRPGYGIDNPGPIPGKYRKFFTSTKHSDWFRDQPSLIFSGYQEFFV